MKLTKKKIKRDVEVCEPTHRLVSKPIKFGRRTLQLVIEDNCGFWMATLADPKAEPWLFLANPRIRRRRRLHGARRAIRRHAVRYPAFSLHFQGFGKNKEEAVENLNKGIAKRLRAVKQFEAWLEDNPIEVD